MIFKDHPMRYIICTHIFAISIVLYTLHTVYSMSHISIYISTICTICSIFVWGLRNCMFRKSRQWKQLWNHLRSRQSVWCRCFLAWLKMDDAGVQLARLARSTKKCLNIFLIFNNMCRCWWWNDRIAPYGPPYVPNLWVQIHSGASCGNVLCCRFLASLVFIPKRRWCFFPAFTILLWSSWHV